MVNVYDELNDLSAMKEETCRACPLYVEINTRAICNPNLYLNVEDKTTVSEEPKVGFKKGCGCSISGKINNPNSTCPLRKW